MQSLAGHHIGKQSLKAPSDTTLQDLVFMLQAMEISVAMSLMSLQLLLTSRPA